MQGIITHKGLASMNDAQGLKRGCESAGYPDAADHYSAPSTGIGRGTGSNSGAAMNRNPLQDHADTLRYLMPFAASEGYLFVAAMSKHWRTAWGDDRPKKTHLDVVVQSAASLAWAKDSGCPWDETIYRRAAAGGSLEALQCARAWGCPWDLETCEVAARNRHLEILQWCTEHICPQNEMTCTAAAAGGHLEILKWCRTERNGWPRRCAWSVWTCAAAAEGGIWRS